MATFKKKPLIGPAVKPALINSEAVTIICVLPDFSFAFNILDTAFVPVPIVNNVSEVTELKLAFVCTKS